MLPGREAATVEAWLKAHPGAAVTCRATGTRQNPRPHHPGLWGPLPEITFHELNEVVTPPGGPNTQHVWLGVTVAVSRWSCSPGTCAYAG